MHLPKWLDRNKLFTVSTTWTHQQLIINSSVARNAAQSTGAIERMSSIQTLSMTGKERNAARSRRVNDKGLVFGPGLVPGFVVSIRYCHSYYSASRYWSTLKPLTSNRDWRVRVVHWWCRLKHTQINYRNMSANWIMSLCIRVSPDRSLTVCSLRCLQWINSSVLWNQFHVRVVHWG